MVTSIRQIWNIAPNAAWLYALLFFVLFVYLLYSFKNYLRIVRFIFTLDGPPARPILGNTGYLYDDNMLYMGSHTLYKDYGPIFRVWLTLFPCVVLLEPDDINQVLGNRKHSEKIVFYKMLDNFLGKGLITRRVDTWTPHRRILQPGFHLQYLEKFTKSFTRCSNRLAKKLASLGGQDVNITSFVNDSVYEILNGQSSKQPDADKGIKNRQYYYILDGTELVCFCHVSETVLGATISGDQQSSLINDELPFRKGKVLVPYRLTRPWLLIDWIYKITSAGRTEQKHRVDLAKACQRILREKRDSRARGEVGSESQKSLLDFMIDISEEYSWFTDEEIVNECCTFMLAGQDSVGTATAMTLFLLGNNREWLDKCVHEIDEIFANRKDDASPSMEDFRAMKYLEMCIKEALRLYPSVPLFFRTLGEDVTIGKHIVPKGCGVMIVPYTTHRLPHHFPDPHSFKPDRFSAENSSERHPYAYLPFSAGPRNCIGYKFAMLEMKSIISAILRKCILRPVPGKQEIRPKFRLTVRAKGGLWLRISSRNHEPEETTGFD